MTEGIDYIHLETHNWGKTVKFWQNLGFKIELDLGNSERLVHPSGEAALFIEEIPQDRSTKTHLYLKTANSGWTPDSPVIVQKDWHPSHWGTQLLEVTDPDSRMVVVQQKPDSE